MTMVAPYDPWAKRESQCRRCGKWFVLGNTSCLVMHPPGECCHEYDREVPEPQWSREQTP